MFASKDSLLTRPSGYNIARSVRLRQSASAYFNRTAGVSPTSNQKGTFSFWFKRGSLATGSEQWLFAGGSNSLGCGIPTNDVMFIEYFGALYLYTTQVFRDPSAWYHMVFAIDTTQATASNRAKLYINGVQVTSFTTEQYPSQNATFNWMASGQACYINQIYAGGRYFDGYMAEFNYIDGQQLTPSSFGETDSITGVWKPKAYSGTYGTNGFELNFSDNSNNTAATIGKDYSGNGNNWTPNNISVTTGATYDSMTDVPTLTSATAANYCTFNPIYNVSNAGSTWSDGNLKFTNSGADNVSSMPTMALPTSGKWYWEITVPTFGSGSNPVVGICDYTGLSGGLGGWWYRSDGNKYNQAGTGFAYGASWTAGSVISVAVDMDAATLTFYKNGVSQGVAWTSITTGVSGTLLYPVVRVNVRGDVYTANFGQQGFAYTPPTGYVALNTYNLPAPTITNGAAYMASTTWTSAGGTETISNAVNGVSFQPDFLWMKNRSIAQNNYLVDSNRGTSKILVSNTSSAEVTDATFVTAFNSNGFSLGSGGFGATQAIVGWQWKAGGTAVTNTDGTITTTVSASPSSGFSVMTYTGTGIDNKTIGHGLGAAPKFLIWKPRASATDWMVWHTGLSGFNYDVRLNTTAAQGTGANPLNNTAPSSTVITLRNQGDVNGSGTTIVCYAFAAVAGYSAFGSYTGNGSADGPFVYTGFRPRWLLLKNSSNATGYNWILIDSARNSYNVADTYLVPNNSNADTSGSSLVDFVSNGIKLRTSGAGLNNSGDTYIYAAFAENPFKNSLAR